MNPIIYEYKRNKEIIDSACTVLNDDHEIKNMYMHISSKLCYEFTPIYFKYVDIYSVKRKIEGYVLKVDTSDKCCTKVYIQTTTNKVAVLSFLYCCDVQFGNVI